MNVLSCLCGFSIPVITLVIIAISEWLKLMMDWGGRYMGVSWFTIWRAERLYKQGKYREYHVLLSGEEAVRHQEEIDRRKYEQP